MRPKQWFGVVIVALAAIGTFVVPGLERGTPERSRPDGPTRGCEDARGRPAAGPTLCLLNAERARRDLRPLTVDVALSRAAERHARDMARRDFFAHESPEGTTPHQRILLAGDERPRMTGENLAFGEREAAAPAASVDGWMHSPGHRRNILRAGFAEIGIGIATRGDRTYYATTFGRRQPR